MTSCSFLLYLFNKTTIWTKEEIEMTVKLDCQKIIKTKYYCLLLLNFLAIKNKISYTGFLQHADKITLQYKKSIIFHKH